MDFKFEEGNDYYIENGRIIFTESYLIKRKACCGSGCKNCPYWPNYTKGEKNLRENLQDLK
jgi:hypothetical protein